MPNSREMLAAAADWLGWQDETLSFGLRNAFDALRLYDYAQAHPDMPEMADDWEVNDFQAAIGYNPFEEPSHEAEHSGAAVAYDALKEARTLIDSVAFIATEGDAGPVLAQIDAVSGPAKTKAPKRRAASPG